MRGLLRRRQRGGTRENETSRAGLRPEDIYVYVERSQGIMQNGRFFKLGKASFFDNWLQTITTCKHANKRACVVKRRALD